MEVDPRLTGEWPDTVVLCWEAPSSLRNYKALYAALISDEGVQSDYLGPGGLSDLVSSIEGYLLQVEYGDFGSLQWMLQRARQYDVPVRRVYMLSTFGDVEARIAPLDKHPAVIAWLVPTQSLSGTGRGAPEGWLSRMADELNRDSPGPLVISDSAHTGLLESRRVEQALQRYLDAGSWAAVVDDRNFPEDCPVAIVEPLTRGDQLVRLGRVGQAFGQAERVTEVAEWASRLIADFADGLEYAVVGVHRTSGSALAGAPFAERRPPTGSAQLSEVAIRFADRVVWTPVHSNCSAKVTASNPDTTSRRSR